MKLSVLFLFTLLSVATLAQPKDLSKLSEKSRNKFLIKTAKKVTKDFGPDYCRLFEKAVIDGPVEYKAESYFKDREEFSRCNGRRYYTVTMHYDESKVYLPNHFASQVRIWEDDGTPMSVILGESEAAVHFFVTSYDQWKKDGIPDRLITPYNESFWKEYMTHKGKYLF